MFFVLTQGPIMSFSPRQEYRIEIKIKNKRYFFVFFSASVYRGKEEAGGYLGRRVISNKVCLEASHKDRSHFYKWPSKYYNINDVYSLH